MITQVVNTVALATAAEFVVGREKADEIQKLYKALDAAMFAGYEMGRIDGQVESDKAVDAAFDEGWDHGYDAGEADGLDEADDAYVQGVADARARPELADANVQDVISRQVQDELNGEFYEGDSGDETDEVIDKDHPEYCDLCGGRCELADED